MDTLFFRWEIPDFLSETRKVLRSDKFSFNLRESDEWFLELHPSGHPGYEDCTSLFLEASHGSFCHESFKVQVTLSIGPVSDDFRGKFNEDKRFVGNYTFFEHKLVNSSKRIIESDGSLVITCKITSETCLYQDSEETVEQLSSDLGRMYREEIGSDLTIVLDNHRIKCHKNIIGIGSKVLRHLIDSNSIINLTSQEYCMNRNNLEINILHSLLEFIYTGRVTFRSVAEAVKLFQVASDCQVKGLKMLSEVFIASNVTISDAVDALICGHLNGSPPIKKACLQVMKGKDSDEIRNWYKIEKYPSVSYLLITKMWKGSNDDTTPGNLEVQETEIMQQVRQYYVKSLITMFKSKLDTDFVLSFPTGHEVHIHKNILRIRSLYFERVLMEDPLIHESYVNDVPYPTFLQLLTYIYSGLVSLNSVDEAVDLFVAASRYEVHSLIPVTEKFISRNVSSENAIKAFIAGHLNGSSKIIESCLTVIKDKRSSEIKNFRNIYEHEALVDLVFKLRDNQIPFT